MQIHLAYGKNGLDVTIPDGNISGVLTMPMVPPIDDPHTALETALDAPIGSTSLSALARGKRSACVVICDITRPVPNAILLPPLLARLEGAGIERKDITVLIATGLHRPSTPDERVALMGAELAARYRVLDHHARNPEQHRHLGTTAQGTPVWIDRTYCDAELRITTGFIEPHLMAGFSGGRKLIAPGCASEETIKALHSPHFLEHPSCREGMLEGNPLHHELLEIARLAGHDFVVNVALDSEHRITGIFAGDPIAAHETGVKFVRHAVHASLPAQADIVVTTSAGHPLDLTYYQAVKGMTAALPLVKEGGALILAAECAEGLGGPEFVRMATAHQSAETFMETILHSPVMIDQWQLEECARAARRADVTLVSGRIHREYAGRLFVSTAPDITSALERSFARLGRDATVAIIPKGPYTLVDVGPHS